MNYRKFPGTDVTASALGMGCMRLPVQDVEGHPIDRPEAIRMIRHAIDNGVNYVDTAWGYHNEDSEVLVGEALQDGYREKAVLTSKLPVWKVEKYEDMERLLDVQLSRLQTDHLDFYLLHALDKDRFHKVVELGVFRFLDDMVKKGKIRYPGFSFHDDAEAFREIVDAYNLPVMCFGLRTDFQTKLFPGSRRLMEVADSILEIKTICDCGAKATVNARIDSSGHIVTEGAQVVLGGNDSYIAMCHKCYMRGIREHRVIRLHGQNKSK